MAKTAEGFEAEDFVAGVPSASILGILGGAVASAAVGIGFLPALIAGAPTAATIATLVFLSEITRVAFNNKNSQ